MEQSVKPYTVCFYLTILTCFSVFSRFQLDHARSNLIWNLRTREELRDALEGEMRAFSVDRELGSSTVISWNHQEFEVCAQLEYDALTAVWISLISTIWDTLQARPVYRDT